MAFFNINEGTVFESIAQGLEAAGKNLSEEQFVGVANRINESLPGVIEVLAYGMQKYWKQEARDSGGWGDKYANAIKVALDGDSARVYVDESLTDKTSNKPNMMYVKMVEEGMKSFSIQDALLKSEKAKISATGIKYMIIPFPVRTPKKKGSKTKSASKFGGREMTREMHRIVKEGGRISSGKLETGQDIAGLTRYNTRQRHSQYGIFRVVSQNSKWKDHPGVPASPVFPSVLKEVDKRIQEVLAEFCKAVVKEFS